VRRSGLLHALVVVGALLLLSSCAGSSPTTAGAALPGGVAVGSSTHTLDVGGRTRSFRVYRPASLPAGAPAPLVVMIHGGGGSAAGAEDRYGWDSEADRAGFLVAYPDGVAHSWNGAATGRGGCCGEAGRVGIDDVGFLTTMVASIQATVPVDPRRVFATGISEGGIMSYRLACSTRLFAAIGPDSATQLGPCPAPAPTSVVHVHGNADTRIPFDGSPGRGPNHITGGPVSAVVDTWRAVDHCPPPTTTTAGPVHTTASTCPDGRAVTLIEVDGAGHQWPGSRPPGPVRSAVTDPPSTALDATDTIWRFFAAHPGV
jgi:polyhydroxybutyrate depolymerase